MNKEIPKIEEAKITLDIESQKQILLEAEAEAEYRLWGIRADLQKVQDLQLLKDFSRRLKSSAGQDILRKIRDSLESDFFRI